VKRAFVDLQGTENLLALKQAAARIWQLEAQLAERQHRAGNISDGMLAAQQASYEKARLDLSATELQLAEKREELNVLLGFPDNPTTWAIGKKSYAVPQSLALPNDFENQALNNRLDLQFAKVRIEVAQNEVTRKRRFRYLPDFSLGVDSEREIESNIW